MEALTEFTRSQFLVQQAIPEAYVLGFLHNSTFAVFVILCSITFSPFVWGVLPPHKRAMWHTTVAAAIQPLYVGYVSGPELYRAFLWALQKSKRSSSSSSSTI